MVTSFETRTTEDITAEDWHPGGGRTSSPEFEEILAREEKMGTLTYADFETGVPKDIYLLETGNGAPWQRQRKSDYEEGRTNSLYYIVEDGEEKTWWASAAAEREFQRSLPPNTADHVPGVTGVRLTKVDIGNGRSSWDTEPLNGTQAN